MSVGELPKGWRWTPLGSVAEINPRRTPIERADDEPTSFVPMEAVDEVQGVAEPILRPYGEIKRGYTAFQDDDVLFAKITPCMQNGKQAIATGLTDGIGFGTTEFHVVRAGEDVLPSWLHRFLRRPSIRGRAAEAFTGAVGQQRVPPDFLRCIPIPLPPLAEQRRVADRLDEAMAEVTGARMAVDRQAQDCSRLKSALIEEVLGGRAIATNDPAEQPGKGWIALSGVARLESGHTPSRKRPEWWGGNVPWIALPDIRAFDGITAEVTSETINELGLANSSARLLPEGTVVLSRTASVGFVTVMGKPMATSQDFVNWVPGPKLRSWYLAYALIGAPDYLRGLSSGAVHKTIYMPTLKSLHIRLPSLHAQDRMVKRIQAAHSIADEARKFVEAQSTALDALPASLLSAAFRGEF
jgi:type I restriction enzyme, S subunit